jgi:hypothetical protein
MGDQQRTIKGQLMVAAGGTHDAGDTDAAGNVGDDAAAEEKVDEEGAASMADNTEVSEPAPVPLPALHQCLYRH